MRRIIVKEYKLTCSACPTQYDVWDIYGNYYYFRLRYGAMRVDYGSYENDCWVVYPDGLDGACRLDDFVNEMYAKHSVYFDFSCATEQPSYIDDLNDVIDKYRGD